MATIKDHMNQKQQGTQSIKHTIDNRHPGCDFVHFATMDTTVIIYIDQTGKFPIQSSRNYKYIVICYVYSCNAILAHPIKNWSATEYYRHISISTPSSTMLVFYHMCTKWTTKCQLISNTSLPPKMLLSNMFLQIITAPMQPSEQSKLGKIISFLVLLVSQKISPLHTGVGQHCSQFNVTQLIRSNQICLWSTPWPFLLSVNTYGTTRNEMFGTHETYFATIMRSACRDRFLHQTNAQTSFLQ